MNEVRIFALGGLDEDGKNLTVVEINQDIFDTFYQDKLQHLYKENLIFLNFEEYQQNTVNAMFHLCLHAVDTVFSDRLEY